MSEESEARLRAENARLASLVASLEARLSNLASMYSDAVDVFNTGFSGYEAVLLGQKQREIFRSTGRMPAKQECVNL